MKIFFTLLVFFLIKPGHCANTLKQIQHLTLQSMQTEKTRMRVGSENMANAESPGYQPKEVIVKPSYDRKAKVHTVKVHKIKPMAVKKKQVFQPSHPQADEKGYVTMPDINPLVQLMNARNAEQNYARALKVHEMATDIRHKAISLIQR